MREESAEQVERWREEVICPFLLHQMHTPPPSRRSDAFFPRHQPQPEPLFPVRPNLSSLQINLTLSATHTATREPGLGPGGR
jgi:hypothetical protein